MRNYIETIANIHVVDKVNDSFINFRKKIKQNEDYIIHTYTQEKIILRNLVDFSVVLFKESAKWYFASRTPVSPLLTDSFIGVAGIKLVKCFPIRRVGFAVVVGRATFEICLR